MGGVVPASRRWPHCYRQTVQGRSSCTQMTSRAVEHFFGWDTLLAKELLEPIRRNGLPFTFQPNHDKPRDIAVPDQTTLLLVEGAGSIRRSLRMLYDATVWVDTAPETARQRLVELGEDPQGYHDDRMIEENSLLNADRPWAHAMFHVSGTNSATNGTVLARRT